MKNLKVVFMGTPTFSVPVLEALIDNTNVLMVVSQPDREKDRRVKIEMNNPIMVCLIMFPRVSG